ncbi:dihydrolipoyl dehydrogenase family protein [Paenisporosarcina antarctica]|uniref:NAD(P)/FAD-dependent oxidoreductase n=1 Tax=Paenisporosarcina antarctica TaxID=417367 RepID=A0A4P7A2V3_9BACL|nr:NAD(P)/FAD-dependent oxidoreductase [Paenisporosarcina antarctica]QBP42286.1 NAD(P)/FAD-dependent oxidoreductase [Paenisporosarcina antarctica]
MKEHKVVVIGAGSGGLYTAAGLARLHVDVALVNSTEKLGGDCLHSGCVPSKSLIYASTQGMSWEQTTQHIRQVIAEIQVHDSVERFEGLGVSVYIGHAKFVSPNEIEVNGQRIRGKKFVIATGSSPRELPIEGLQQSGYLTNELLFHLIQQPKSLGIIGAGPIALELGQAMAKLGTDVHIVNRDKEILGKFDSSIRKVATRHFESEMTFYNKAEVTCVEVEGSQKRLTLSDGKQILVDDIMVAAGRIANIGSLRLENAGVKMNDGFIQVKDTYQTSLSHIYAIGDVIDTYAHTHAAGLEARAVIEHIAFTKKKKNIYFDFAAIIYSTPEVYQLFGNDTEVVETLEVNSKDIDRYKTQLIDDVVIRIGIDKKGYVINAQAVGPNISDLMQLVAYTKRIKKPISSWSSMTVPYPTHAQILQQIANTYMSRTLEKPIVQSLIKTYISVRELSK